MNIISILLVFVLASLLIYCITLISKLKQQENEIQDLENIYRTYRDSFYRKDKEVNELKARLILIKKTDNQKMIQEE